MPIEDQREREDLGRTLKALRLAQGLTLCETSDRSGVARATICTWENGTHSPSGAALDAVLSTLRADPGLRSRLLLLATPRYAQDALRTTHLGAPVHAGQLLRAMRLRREMAQGQLALDLGVGQAHVARWEAGDLQIPADLQESALILLGASEIEKQAFVSIGLRTDPFEARSLEEGIHGLFQLPHTVQPIVLLAWEAELWRRATEDDRWLPSLLRVVALRANACLMNGELREIAGLANRAMTMAKMTQQWEVATHAFYADRWRRRSKDNWASEAEAMHDWASRLPDSLERAWIMTCHGLALAHLGHQPAAVATTERAIEMAERFGLNREYTSPLDLGEMWLALGEPDRALEALGESVLPSALYLRAMAHFALGEEAPRGLLERARGELGSRSWFHRQKLAEIERTVGRRAAARSSRAPQLSRCA